MPTEPGVLARPPAPFVPTARADPFVFMSGVIATDHTTGLLSEARVTPGLPHYALPMHLQLDAMLGQARMALAAAGAHIEDTVSITSFLTDVTQAPYAREIRGKYFRASSASTAVIVGELPVQDAVTAMDIIALAADSPYRPEMVNTERAPLPPSGRYPQAVRAGPFVFTAGQIPTNFVHSVAPEAQIDPAFPYFGRSIKRQAAFILRNIAAVLEAAGSSLAHVVKVMVYLPDSSDFQGLDEVWREVFPSDPPARTVAPARTLFPDARLEIYTVAVTADGPVKKEVVATARAPTPTIHQSQAIRAGNLVFLSGLLPTDFVGALAPSAQLDPALPWHDTPMRRQAGYVLECAQAILEAAGTDLAALVRWQAYMPVLDGLPALQAALAAHADPTMPTGTVVRSCGPLIIPEAGLLLDLTAAVR